MKIQTTFAIAALALAGCGGGDGNSTPATTVAVVTTPTNTAPVIASAIADQATDMGYEFSLDLSGTFSDAKLSDPF
jgi:ABC-type metal ion transport system substrate-binding protein